VRLDADVAMRRAGFTEPAILLEGRTPRLIDEWQRVPDVWDAVRNAVDDRQQDGQFILTGSATPSGALIRHSGAMRVSRLQMRPMSLFESGDSTGAISLAALLTGEKLTAVPPAHDLAAIAELTCRGGWPATLHRRIDDAQQSARDYLDTIAGTDLSEVDGIRRDPRKVKALLFSLARHNATYTDLKVLAADATGQGEPVTSKTVSTYLDPLLRLWVVDEQYAWGGHLRSAPTPAHCSLIARRSASSLKASCIETCAFTPMPSAARFGRTATSVTSKSTPSLWDRRTSGWHWR